MDWTDSISFRANNCKANVCTNGYDLYAPNTPKCDGSCAAHVQQEPGPPSEDAHGQPLGAILGDVRLLTAALPPGLEPTLQPVPGSYSVAQFYYLGYAQTGILALGGFDGIDFDDFQKNLFKGLSNLKALGAKRLIVDVTNNGGGFICSAHWLYRLIAGAKNPTERLASLYTETRAQPLAQAITAAVAQGVDPNHRLLYNPGSPTLSSANNTPFPDKYDWLKYPVKKVINGREDFFSQKLGRECNPPESINAPLEGLFDPKEVAIISNGRCGSSCSLFSVSFFMLLNRSAAL